MKITERQKRIIQRLSVIKIRRKLSGRTGYFLLNDDISSTVNSLVVKGVLTRSQPGRPVALTKEAEQHLDLIGT